MKIQEKIVAMYEDGISWDEIGEQLNLKKNQIDVYRSCITKYYHRKDEFQALRNLGMTVVEISEKTNVHERAIIILTKCADTNQMIKYRKAKEAEEKQRTKKQKEKQCINYYIDHNEPLSGCGELPKFLQGIGPVKIKGKPNRMAGVPEHLYGKKREDDPKGEVFYVSKKFR